MAGSTLHCVLTRFVHGAAADCKHPEVHGRVRIRHAHRRDEREGAEVVAVARADAPLNKGVRRGGRVVGPQHQQVALRHVAAGGDDELHVQALVQRLASWREGVQLAVADAQPAHGARACHHPPRHRLRLEALRLQTGGLQAPKGVALLPVGGVGDVLPLRDGEGSSVRRTRGVPAHTLGPRGGGGVKAAEGVPRARPATRGLREERRRLWYPGVRRRRAHLPV
eukprot:1761553-Pyramimonas_sp.AAC.1